jgi:hypothetical protein
VFLDVPAAVANQRKSELTVSEIETELVRWRQFVKGDRMVSVDATAAPVAIADRIFDQLVTA